MLIKQLNDTNFLFFCPACDEPHVIDTADGTWTFNNDYQFPSFKPSYYQWDPNYVCHLHVTDGMLHFHPDSTHDSADSTIKMVQIPGWLSDEPETEEIEAEETEDDEFYYPELPTEDDNGVYLPFYDPGYPEIDDFPADCKLPEPEKARNTGKNG